MCFKLTLNFSKTKYIIFQPREKSNLNHHPLKEIASRQPLDLGFIVKYLGLNIDCHLLWQEHVNYIWTKIIILYVSTNLL